MTVPVPPTAPKAATTKPVVPNQKSSSDHGWYSSPGLWQRKSTFIGAFSIAAIVAYLWLRFGLRATSQTYEIPLLATLILGGLPMLYDLLRKLLKLEFGSDLLGGISIITSVLLGQYLAGSVIVLMLAGGEALEGYALRSASSVLNALAKRLPSVAHRKRESEITDVELKEIAVTRRSGPPRPRGSVEGRKLGSAATPSPASCRRRLSSKTAGSWIWPSVTSLDQTSTAGLSDSTRTASSMCPLPSGPRIICGNPIISRDPSRSRSVPTSAK